MIFKLDDSFVSYRFPNRNVMGRDKRKSLEKWHGRKRTDARRRIKGSRTTLLLLDSP